MAHVKRSYILILGKLIQWPLFRWVSKLKGMSGAHVHLVLVTKKNIVEDAIVTVPMPWRKMKRKKKKKSKLYAGSTISNEGNYV